jgi:predicted ATPase
MATLPKVLINRADYQIGGGVALRLRTQGSVLLSQRKARDAEESYQRALLVARSQHARFWEIRAATTLARLWRDQGKRDEARELLAPVYGRFTENPTRAI